MSTLRNRERLAGVHPDLVRVIEAAALTAPFAIAVLEGLRSQERHAGLLASGASRTKHSRHLTGHAVDLAPLVGTRVSWDWQLYNQLGPHVLRTASEIAVPLEWGGNWKKFRDGPHFQLPRKEYPA